MDSRGHRFVGGSIALHHPFGEPCNLTPSGVSVGTFCRTPTLSRYRADSRETIATGLPCSGDVLSRGLRIVKIRVPVSETLTSRVGIIGVTSRLHPKCPEQGF